jgi:hypothetical protein
LSSASTDTRKAILRNARAAEWERLLNLADPGRTMSEDERTTVALKLQREKLQAAGRKGRETQQRLMEDASYLRRMAADIQARLEDLLDVVRSAQHCRPGDHLWPDELPPDAQCTECGLEYGEWSAP